MIYDLPIKTVSEMNVREHWGKRSQRVKEQRETAHLLTRSAINGKGWKYAGGIIKVTLTRIAPRELDSDNLTASFKAIRDGVADGLWMKNDHDNFEWVYKQLKGEYSVMVEVEQV